jgi:hypothetical protein
MREAQEGREAAPAQEPLLPTCVNTALGTSSNAPDNRDATSQVVTITTAVTPFASGAPVTQTATIPLARPISPQARFLTQSPTPTPRTRRLNAERSHTRSWYSVTRGRDTGVFYDWCVFFHCLPLFLTCAIDADFFICPLRQVECLAACGGCRWLAGKAICHS